MKTIPWKQAAFTAAPVSTTLAVAQQVAVVPAIEPGRAGRDVTALVALGPRVAGTEAMEKTNAYLIAEYRKAGYEASEQTFTYDKFSDLGSSLTLGGTKISGSALRGSRAGTFNTRFVTVPGPGRPADFAKVDVKGAIALVRRGEIPFSEKASHAATAGALALVVVNNTPASFGGTLGEGTTIPVLGISGAAGEPLLTRAGSGGLEGRFEVNARFAAVTGRNVVARFPGATRPKLVIGGHSDSVAGAPGANDNASGTAAVLEIARAMAGTAHAREVFFVAFDGEEDGLHGSRAFVSQMGQEFTKNLTAMLNFDMVGDNETLYLSGTQTLIDLARTVDDAIIASRVGSSDHVSFAAVGVPNLFFYRGSEPDYHLPTDTEIDPDLVDGAARVGLEVAYRLLTR